MASSTSGVAKRKHVTTACVSCRESKVKCDGMTPACSNCKNRGKDCRYQAGDDKRKLSLRIAIELLLARVAQLNSFLGEHGLRPPPMDGDSQAVLTRALSSLRIANNLLDVLDQPYDSASAQVGSSPDSIDADSARGSNAAVQTRAVTRVNGNGMRLQTNGNSASANPIPAANGNIPTNDTNNRNDVVVAETGATATAATATPTVPSAGTLPQETIHTRPRISRTDSNDADQTLSVDINDSYPLPHAAVHPDGTHHHLAQSVFPPNTWSQTGAPVGFPATGNGYVSVMGTDALGDWLAFNGVDMTVMPPTFPSALPPAPMAQTTTTNTMTTTRLPLPLPTTPATLAAATAMMEDDAVSDADSTEELIDQLSDRMGSLQIGPRGHIRYYGATSNFNLVDMPAPDNLTVHRTVRHDGQEYLDSLGIGKAVPPDLEAHLITLYFTWQDPAYHVVDRDRYEAAKRVWYDNQEDTPYYSEALRNALCALGAAFEPRHHPTFVTFPQSLSDFFADRAKALLEIEMDAPCVATVQALAVLSGHDIGCKRDARGWLYSGMGLRLAFDLALHVDMSAYVAQGILTEAECCLRRTVFWGAYVADHLWGFYLGRSLRTNMEDVTVAKPGTGMAHPATDRWLSYGSPISGTAAAMEELTVETDELGKQRALLCEIGAPMGHMLYGNPTIPPAALQSINEKTVAAMEAWKSNLPPALQVDPDDETRPYAPHVLLLHMQYNQIMIHAHRPWMSRTYVQPFPPQGAGSGHARQTCINCAVEMAKLLQLYEKRYTFRRMNVQAVGMTCSAGLLLLFAVMTGVGTNSSRTKSNSAAVGAGTAVVSTTAAATTTATTTTTTAATATTAPTSTPLARAPMGQHLNTCFRALDELALSWETAKRAHEFLVLLQRQWEKRRRRAKTNGSNGPITGLSLPGVPQRIGSRGSRGSRGSLGVRGRSHARQASWNDVLHSPRKRARTLSRENGGPNSSGAEVALGATGTAETSAVDGPTQVSPGQEFLSSDDLPDLDGFDTSAGSDGHQHPRERRKQARLGRNNGNTNFEMGLALDWIFPGETYAQGAVGEL